MKHCKLLGIDLAKTVFQLCGMDKNNHILFNKQVKRSQLLKTIVDINPESICMESCYSSNHWGRLLEKHGLVVKLIPPQHVKPFVKGNKNDYHDAIAICEASRRPGIHFVPVKTLEQQDLQTLHNARQRKIRDRTSLVNQIRGLLSEYGIILNKGYKKMPKQLPAILEDASNGITFTIREVINSLLDELRQTNKQIKAFEQHMEQLSILSPAYQRLLKIPGIGQLTASAIISQVGNAREFTHARGMAAWLGLTPKHQASGNRITSQGISKRGNRYLRTLLIHGARVIVSTYKNKQEPLKQFADRIHKRQGKHKAMVAVAHKMARIIWAVLANDKPYDPNIIKQCQVSHETK